jgi:hypothetical protein
MASHGIKRLPYRALPGCINIQLVIALYHPRKFQQLFCWLIRYNTNVFLDYIKEAKLLQDLRDLPRHLSCEQQQPLLVEQGLPVQQYTAMASTTKCVCYTTEL